MAEKLQCNSIDAYKVNCCIRMEMYGLLLVPTNLKGLDGVMRVVARQAFFQSGVDGTKKGDPFLVQKK